MNCLNSLILEGNIVKAIEKNNFIEFSIACHRCFKDKNEVDFFDCIFPKCDSVRWEHFTKGRGIRIVGRLEQKKFKNIARVFCSNVRVVAEHIEFKPKKEGV